ncbi:MAG: hypothetical protein MI702_00790 [Chlorobiales bacterium]|nr:hypothetical protein [Chlorobiales bacterium]
MGTQRVIQDAFSKMGLIKRALDGTPGIDVAMMDEARALEKRLQDLNEELSGDNTPRGWGDAVPPSIQSRIFSLMFGHWGTFYGPTKTHRASLEIALQQYEELVPKLRTLIEVDIVAFEEKMEAAGVPWTPGRKIPTLKK